MTPASRESPDRGCPAGSGPIPARRSGSRLVDPGARCKVTRIGAGNESGNPLTISRSGSRAPAEPPTTTTRVHIPDRYPTGVRARPGAYRARTAHATGIDGYGAVKGARDAPAPFTHEN